MKVRIVDQGKVNYLRSQGLYHGLGHALGTSSPDTIVLAIPSSHYMCVGNFQDPRSELDIAYCNSNRLPIIRRQTGGGAVYIDHHQLFVQWIFQKKTLPTMVNEKFEYFLKPMIETYRHFGIAAYSYKSHDVHVKGKKIVGTGAARIGEAEVVTGNFIQQFDSRHMVGALNLPDQEMRAQVSDSMKEYMASLTSELTQIPDFEEVKTVYKKQCKSSLGLDIYEGSLTDEEEVFITKANQKLSNDAWTYANQQPAKNSRIVKIHSGLWIGQSKVSVGSNDLRLTLRLKDDTIDHAHVEYHADEHVDLQERLEKSLLNCNLFDGSLDANLKQCFSNGYDQSASFTENDCVEALNMIKTEKRKISGGV